jgi:phosphoglycerate dehydrogenase-like enzyme
MAWRVLVSAPYFLPVFDRFGDYFAQHGIEPIRAKVNERLEEADLLPLVSDIDGTICGDDRYTARVIEAALRLKVISKWGTGIDSIDAAAAAKRGIRVCRTPDAFTQPVADSVLGYVLAFARRLHWMDAMMKSGQWDKIPGRALNECTLGVVGVGAIGIEVLRRAKPFGLTLLGTDIRTIESRVVESLGVKMVSLGELLAKSDFVSVNCDLNPSSHHLLSDAEFALIKPGAVVINLARGPVIDEPALIRALQSFRVGGAALDVFEDEPLPQSSPLRRMDNVMLAPHNSNSSPAAWERVHLMTLNNLVEGLKAAR